MSSMLEQAIVDAQALREAALKNAEQALIEKFAPQIKEAVESLLENDATTEAKKKVAYEGKAYNLLEIDDGKATIMREGEKPFVVAESELSEVNDQLLQEEEVDMSGGAAATESAMTEPFSDLPYAAQDDESEIMYDLDFEEMENQVLDLGNAIDSSLPAEEATETYDDAAADLGAEPEEAPVGEPEEDDPLAGLDLQENDLVQEIVDLMNEMEDNSVLEEELTVEMGIGSDSNDGTFQTHKETLEYYEEMRKAKEVAEEKEEENKDLKKENEELKETIIKFKHKNKQYKDVVEKLSKKVNETLLSNAKLLYSNKTLSDASLNERQKTKIVEAIAKSRTPEEAKHLCETLNATVTSGGDRKSPRTLSESVQRKSNLSGILPRRQQVKESQEHTFAEKMKKLAGIK